MKKGTKILVNSKNHPKGECSVDATGNAMKSFGKNIPNVALLGGFAKMSGLFSLDDLKKAVEIEFKGKNKEMLKKNVEAAKLCFEEVKC